MVKERVRSWLIAMTDAHVLLGVILLADVALILTFVILSVENYW